MFARALGLGLLCWWGVALGSGCSPARSPQPASASKPTIVLRPVPKPCTQATLDSATPWRGTIVRRERVVRQTVPSAALVRSEWVLCGAMDARECMSWAKAAAKQRVGRTGLEFEVTEGRSDRGTLWVLDLAGREEAVLTPDNRTFVEQFRGLLSQGKSPLLLYRERIREARYGRVEIAYRRPSPEVYVEELASRWELQIEADPQAVVETSLALEDLEPQGIGFDADTWLELSELAMRLEGVDEAQTRLSPRLGAPKPSNAPPLHVEVLAHCER